MALTTSSRKKLPALNSPAILLTLTLILFNIINLSRASSSTTFSSSSAVCNGSIHDCFVADSDSDDFEFLMDSHSSRMLVNYDDVTGKTGTVKVVLNCGRGDPYERCTPNPNAPKVSENAGVYNRGQN